MRSQSFLVGGGILLLAAAGPGIGGHCSECIRRRHGQHYYFACLKGGQEQFLLRRLLAPLVLVPDDVVVHNYDYDDCSHCHFSVRLQYQGQTTRLPTVAQLLL